MSYRLNWGKESKCGIKNDWLELTAKAEEQCLIVRNLRNRVVRIPQSVANDANRLPGGDGMLETALQIRGGW